MNKSLSPLIILTSIAILSSCNTGQKNDSAASDPLINNIDSTVKPGDDFFLFANGTWFKKNPIPNSEQQNGLWQLIQDTINAQVRNLCESSAAMTGAKPGSDQQKIGDFFFTGMDSVMLNKNGISGLDSELQKISQINDAKGILKEAAYIQTVSGSPLFEFYVGQDDRISNKNAVFIEQGGLSLPNRNYYFDTDARAVTVREKFVMHLCNMFRIMGYDSAKAKDAATNMMKLETAIAGVSRKEEDTRDPINNYHKFSFQQLKESSPDMDWNIFMEEVNLPHIDTVIVGQLEFLTGLNTFIKSFPLDDWKNYLKFHFIHRLSRYMDDKTFMETFNFYSAVLRGVKEPKPRWKRTVEQTNSSLGELIGQVYIKDYLPKGSKEKLIEIGNSVRDVYASRIKDLDWMSPQTKEKALNKLNHLIMKVGYPDKWKDLNSLHVSRASYVVNVMNANRWEFNYMTSKYGKPVDRTEWDMEPQTYNAYYNPSNNEIVVPGCNIIIPGYERRLADDALLYSVIGATFGHEMTHGFDDQGSKYDEKGNLNNWWTTDDSVKFYTKTKKIVKQFDGYVVVDGLHINGNLTQGENIADLGGVMFAYQAFKNTQQYKEHQLNSGLNPDQRFFLGYAYSWMINQRPEALADQVRSNVHAPAKYRVIGPLTDMPEFFTAFNIKEGDAMWRPDSARVRIW